MINQKQYHYIQFNEIHILTFQSLIKIYEYIRFNDPVSREKLNLNSMKQSPRKRLTNEKLHNLHKSR